MNLFANNNQNRSNAPLFPPLSTNTNQSQGNTQPPAQNPPPIANPLQSNPQTTSTSSNIQLMYQFHPLNQFSKA